MYLIVGLGNPEPEYSNTRHNMGFDVINNFAAKYNIKIDKKRFKSLYGQAIINNEKVMLVKPQTFMNLSGEAIIEFVKYYKVNLENLIIIYDDIDIEPGVVKIRKKGGAGSHNGMKSVIQQLGSNEFIHIRVGTGKPLYKIDLINYVIGQLTKDEYEILKKGIQTGVDSVEKILEIGIDNTMNRINTKN